GPFLDELARAHRSSGRFRTEERIRATISSLAPSADAAADLTATLDLLQARLALLRPPDMPDGDDIRRDRSGAKNGGRSIDAPALVRRAGELRDDLRFVLRASEAEYVYFVELRGRGVFLRASPIDVSAI